MVWKVRFSSKANIDFKNIIDYLITEWSDKQIKSFNNILDDKVLFISKFPFSYPAIPNNVNIRKCALNKQVSLFYQIKAETIIVLRLFDSRSNPSNLKLQN